MRKILFVAYSYPPVGGIGVLRTLKFTKYLPQFGFTPFVLTVKNRTEGTLDPTLLAEVPPEAKVIGAVSREGRVRRAARLLRLNPKLFSIPDRHIGWLPSAVRSGRAIIREENIDVIFATAPVFTSLLVGYALKKLTGKPLVLDFRDPWTGNVFKTTYPTRLHRRLDEKLEKLVLQSADYVVTTTEEITHTLVDKYPDIHDRCATIPNGFDSSDFNGLKRSVSSDRFTITYAGSLYGLRTGKHFLTALSNLLATNNGLRHQIRVVFVGHPDTQTVSLVQEFQLQDVVQMSGFVPHRESLQLMMDADVLLLVIAQREAVGNGMKTMMIPGKTFEYLATRRPILALAPEGNVSDLIRRTGSGVVVPPEKVDAIERAILDLFGRWQTGTLSVSPYDISVYERKALSAKLATLLESVSRGVSERKLIGEKTTPDPEGALR